MISPMRRADRDGLLRRCQPDQRLVRASSGFRNFRVDRILSSQLLDEHFSPEQGRLTAAWHALSKEAPGGPSAGSKVAKGA
jgi:predicted DNA-binding transcriptional regulator YafY